MPKTPDEIKKAMLHCSPVSCRSNDCPYKDDTPKYEGDMPVCRMKLWHDMVCLIRQLEAERDALAADFKLYRERNIKQECGVYACDLCKHGGKYEEWEEIKCPKGCMGIKNWEWRGVQKEESEDGKE